MLRRSFVRNLVSASAGGFLLRSKLLAQQAVIAVTPLRSKLRLLTGAGGNIVILEGQEGLLMVDSGLPDTISAVLGETGKIGKGQVTRLINTHWHTDHTGGNTDLGKKGAKILAHENVKTRLPKKQYMAFFKRTVEPLPPEGLPVETFGDRGKLKFAGETLHYHHLPPAHTDGDSVIHFQNANVYHGGDLLFTGMYPFIDYSSRGSLEGMAGNAEKILKEVDENTVIVPGHGAVAQKKDVKEYADMLASSLDIFSKNIREGKSLEQMQAAKPFSAYDDKWGKGFIKPEAWIALNYEGMTAKPS